MALGSPFRVDWLDGELTRNEREEIERAAALKGAAILRAARFARTMVERGDADMEVRVWLETDLYPVQVAVWWEPRMKRFWFPLLDATDRGRLGLLVFERVPSVDRDALERDDALFTEALRGILPEAGDVRLADVRLALPDGMTETGVKR